MFSGNWKTIEEILVPYNDSMNFNLLIKIHPFDYFVYSRKYKIDRK